MLGAGRVRPRCSRLFPVFLALTLKFLSCYFLLSGVTWPGGGRSAWGGE